MGDDSEIGAVMLDRGILIGHTWMGKCALAAQQGRKVAGEVEKWRWIAWREVFVRCLFRCLEHRRNMLHCFLGLGLVVQSDVGREEGIEDHVGWGASVVCAR